MIYSSVLSYGKQEVGKEAKWSLFSSVFLPVLLYSHHTEKHASRVISAEMQ